MQIRDKPEVSHIDNACPCEKINRKPFTLNIIRIKEQARAYSHGFVSGL